MFAYRHAAARATAFLVLLAGGAGGLRWLQDEPVNYGGLILVGSLMLVELYVAGWRGSSLRRLLQAGNATSAADLFYGALILGGLFSCFVTGLSFGLDHTLSYLLTLVHATRPRLDLSLSLALGLPLMFLLDSLAVYGAHRLLHTRWLWPLHAVHHAAREMTMLTTYRLHPLESLVRGGFVVLPGLLFGLDPVVAVAYVKFGALQVLWQHSNLPSPFPWVERWLFAGPVNHRLHHAAAAHLRDRNFANCPLIDRLFGTFTWSEEEPVLGIEDRRYATGNPLVEMFAVEWRWLKAMLSGRHGSAQAQIAERT